MSDIKEERMKEIIRQKASEFLERESSGNALLTVTSVKLIERGTKAVISFTVFPATSENGAQETKLFRLPFIDFQIDLGEKNRQKIDSLSQL